MLGQRRVVVAGRDLRDTFEADNNLPAALMAFVPGAGLVTEARSLAGFYDALLQGRFGPKDVIPVDLEGRPAQVHRGRRDLDPVHLLHLARDLAGEARRIEARDARDPGTTREDAVPGLRNRVAHRADDAQPGDDDSAALHVP